MAKAKKLPSGNWRILVYSHTDELKKRHYESFTAPTKAEVEYQAARFKKDKKQNKKTPKKITVNDAIEKYIELSEQVLSPITIASYRKMQKFGFQDIMDVPLSKLSDEMLQEAVNKESQRISERTGEVISPKTIRNEWGLLAPAFKSAGYHFEVRLPKSQRKNKVLPPPEKILEAIKGTDVELMCLLAMWMSFSISEIRGIKCSSIHEGYISIDQVVIFVKGERIVKENAKVDTRKRIQQCPDYIMDLINATESYQAWIKEGKDDYLINTSTFTLLHHYSRIMASHGLDITFHDLRHVFASVMLNILNIPEGIVQEEGGWKTPHVMKGVYRNLFTDSRKKADAMRDDYFESVIQKIKEDQ